MSSSSCEGHGIVVVGGGQGGSQLAASLRDSGYVLPITIIGDEPHLPYQRPPLSKAYLESKIEGPGLALRASEFFDRANISLVCDRRAIAIDREAKTIITDDNSQFEYDHLVLATGARNRRLDVPGHDLFGVFHLRTLDDAEAFRFALPTISSIVIVGAGFIGLELAALAAARGLRVEVIELADRPMARAVSLEMSNFFGRAHSAEGIRFRFGQHVTRITGENGRVMGVETSVGDHLAADAVLIGIGVVANDEIARAAGLETANGILVDKQLKTRDPAISAIGDCVAYPQPFAGGAIMRVESVQNAVDQARCVASRLSGKPADYSALPWFWSDQGRWKLQIAGIADGHDETVVRGDQATGSFSIFCFRHGALAAVESVNKPAEHVVARRLIGQGAAVTPTMAADVSIDLKSIAARGQAAA